MAVEQPSDINSAAWLKNIFPCEVKDLRVLPRHPELQSWLRSSTWATNSGRGAASPNPYNPGRVNSAEADNPSPFAELPDDFDFENKEMQVAVATVS